MPREPKVVSITTLKPTNSEERRLIAHDAIARRLILSGSVSDVDEYQALRAEQQRTTDERHKAYMDFVNHKKAHQLRS
jgi:hypothetical protein